MTVENLFMMIDNISLRFIDTLIFLAPLWWDIRKMHLNSVSFWVLMRRHLGNIFIREIAQMIFKI